MVVVTREPETEPMLATQDATSPIQDQKRKNSCPEELYQTVTSAMRADPLEIKSPKLALELLQTATQLQNRCLARQCVENLDRSLTRHTALFIYAFLGKCKTPNSPRSAYEPSAPPMTNTNNSDNPNNPNNPNNSDDSDWAQKLLLKLRANCLLVIDKDADSVLKQKEIVDLSYSDLSEIVLRDTLQVSSEVTVYSAIVRWGLAECHRMTLSTHHLKEVLRQLCYAPRYGLMTRKEFTLRTVDGLKGPTRSGVLEEKDWRLIKFYIEERAKKRPTSDLPHRMSRARMSGLDTKAGPRKEACRGRAKCEECLLNFLSCWTAVFD